MRNGLLLMAALVTALAPVLALVLAAVPVMMAPAEHDDDLGAMAMMTMLASAALLAAALLDLAVVDAHVLGVLADLAAQLRELGLLGIREGGQNGVSSLVLGCEALLDDLGAQVGERHLEAVLWLGDGEVAVVGGLASNRADIAAAPAQRLLGFVLAERAVADLVDDLDEGALAALEAARAVLAHGELGVVGGLLEGRDGLGGL